MQGWQQMNEGWEPFATPSISSGQVESGELRVDGRRSRVKGIQYLFDALEGVRWTNTN